MIQSATLEFLKDLVQNNDREWFQDHKQRYESAKENIVNFAAEVIKELKKIDPAIATDVDPRKCVMRIYRDVRFSKDKRPYKSNFGIGKLLANTKVEENGY
jgi:uncharacterized protein (TIGR02453 family)